MHGSGWLVGEYVFYVFFQHPNKRHFTLFEVSYQKRKNAESIIQISFQSTAVFTVLHFEIADTFAGKQLHKHTTH